MAETLTDIDTLETTLLDDGYVLVLHNDDHNTFEWVIQTLMELVDYNFDEAARAAQLVHTRGKVAVVSGSYEEMADLHESFGRRDLTTSVEVL